MLSLAIGFGCALDPSVTVYPLLLSATTDRPFDHFVNLVEARDYAAALEREWTVQEKGRPSGRELAALGQFQMVRGLFEEAALTLERAHDLAAIREERAETAWDLSQTFFLAGDYRSSLSWAGVATDNGLEVAEWHLALLEALAGYDLQPGIDGAARMPLIYGDPRVPRVEVVANGVRAVEGVIDSGAVFTVLSDRLAKEAGVQRLGRRGTLLGLLGEPIAIEFGVLDHLTIGGLTAVDLLVAIMPEEVLSFSIGADKRYQMEMLIGTNLLRHLRIEIDFPDERVELTPVPKDPAIDQNLFFYDFRPMVQVSLNRRGWLPFLLDTGSEVTFLNGSLLEATRLRNRSQIHGATLQGLGGSRTHGSQLVNVELITAGWGGTFRTLPMYESEHSQVFGILGENFLDKFEVVIDFGKMRFDLMQSGKSASDWLEESGAAAPTGIEPS